MHWLLICYQDKFMVYEVYEALNNLGPDYLQGFLTPHMPTFCPLKRKNGVRSIDKSGMHGVQRRGCTSGGAHIILLLR